MKVFLLKDVQGVGLAGEIIKVSDGYATNFLFPRQLALEITPANEQGILKRMRVVENRKEVIVTKTSILAEKIKSLKLVLKAKIHDGEKLYGAVAACDIVELLAAQGVSVAKNQVMFEKTIKTKGTHPITIKLSNSLQPTCTLKVVAE